MPEFLLLEPVDVLFSGSHKSFGTTGPDMESLMPPWPSVAAGALRSALLARSGVSLAAYAQGRAQPPEPLASWLGTPDRPGSFRVTHCSLGRLMEGKAEPIFAVPADVVVLPDGPGGGVLPRTLEPQRLSTGLPQCSWDLPAIPVLRVNQQAKAASGWWLTGEGLARYVAGEALQPSHLLPRDALWREERRLGIGLRAETRTVAAGLIYTASAAAMEPGVGLLVGVEGVQGPLECGPVVRLGGEGRGARVHSPVPVDLPGIPWERIEAEGRFRVVLTTPGLFSRGLEAAGSAEDGRRVSVGIPWSAARLVSACVPRYCLVGGWDLARGLPKAAWRAAPVGSVWWFEDLKGGIGGLQRLFAEGLWILMTEDEQDAARRAEGFNNILVAAWPPAAKG